VLGVQLRQEGGLAPPLVVRPGDADLAAEPAVAEQGGELVRADLEQAGDVVGLDLEPRGVLGEAGGQLLVADPAPAEERLVEAVRRGVQPAPGDWLADGDGPAQLVGRAPRRGERVRFRGPDPAGRPVGRGERPGLEGGRLRPRRLAAAGVGLDLPAHLLACC
jgi:hypothetical protein